MLNLKEIIVLLFFVMVMIIMFIDRSRRMESYTNINKLNDTNKQVVNFCRRLRKYDKPSDHTVMLRNFRKRKLEKNNTIIKTLFSEIESMQKELVNTRKTKINDYKCKLQKKATKQIAAINKAKDNIENRNKIVLNINPV
jgi:hypothetical protein